MFRFYKCVKKPLEKYFSSKKEVFDFRRDSPVQQDSQVQSLIIHPIFYPNKGLTNEIYMAEEAIGLAKSLNWKVVNGPFQKQNTTTIQDQMEPTIQTLDSSQIKDGEYIYTPLWQGTYYKGGILVDPSSSETESDNEWTNEKLRNSIAINCMIKIKNAKLRTVFPSGKLQEIGYFIKNNDVSVVFLNTELSAQQTRNLEKYWNGIANDKPIDQIFKKRHNPLIPSDVESMSENDTDSENNQQQSRKIKVFDRFSIILQIFAKRAKTKMARYQIELSFMNFLKSKLSKEGSTYSALNNIFDGDLLEAEEINLEVVSAKQKSIKGNMMGEGESQREIQKRLIFDRITKLNEKIAHEQKVQIAQRVNKNKMVSQVPSIALIGYTNAGKSQLMNMILGKEIVKSANLLFQTLNTTERKHTMKNGQIVTILDTIGFISNLPHDLIQSFNCTLEEVLEADILIHVRDISHPNTQQQNQIVDQVLTSIYPNKTYLKKIIEVWNKIDLLEEPINIQVINNSEVPIIPISALHGTNQQKLLEVINDKINYLKNKRLYTLKHSLQDHGEKLKWIFKNGNVIKIENEKYSYKETKEYPQGFVEFDVLLDETTYRRYKSQFGIQEQNIPNPLKQKGMPPPNWK